MRQFTAILSALAVSVIGINARILNTTCEHGEIEGVRHNGYALYKAISYAEPPVGRLRWHAPVKKHHGKVSIRPTTGATARCRTTTLTKVATTSP